MKRLKTKIIVLISIVLIVVASITTIVFAVFTKTSTRGNIEVSADTLTASTTYTSKQEAYDWTYTKAGDTKEIEISTKNESDFILHRYYVIEKNTNKTNDDNLLSAIMVYYNDKYIGQLIDVIENQIEIYDEYVFVEKTKTKTDSLKFELHQAASNSIFDSKNISINITTYTENANYLNNIFVSTEEEFKHAVDDINSGLFENIPKIVLCNTLTLNNSYTILNPACIYLNGSTLNGSLELNDTDALLEVLGDGTFNVDVTLTKYDSDKAKELVINNIKDKLKYGIASGDSIDILGHYAFYNHTISANATVTYTKPNIIAPSVSNTLYSKAGQITVAGEKISFKVKGSKTALLEDTLKHLPLNDSILTTDLFLPTYIPSENAVITWLSSNEDILTSDGKIAARRIDSEEVSLYAEIKINDTVLTKTYTFKVSAHNNEINFYKLVQEISPIVINNIYSSSDDSDDALYHLPIVSQNNDGTFNNYDYRTSYESPVNTKLFNWSAYRDIGLENITYSMTPEEKQAYEYITLSDNELYLNTTTLNNYAKINITGDFGNDETYTTTIHVSIAVGTDTQLLEKAFTQISEELDTISVLGNILKTRKTSGMKNEKGDFSLTSVYLENSDYTIEFSGESDIIPSIVKDLTEDKYNFSINPEYFNEYETTVAFSATVYYKKGSEQEKSKSRTFYVVVPAALHVKDFTTISIYNATKYQVVNQLGLTTNTGYSKTGTTLSDSNLDYILLRDIVGDETYIAEYKASDYYLEVANITLGDYTGVKTLTYNVNNSNNTNTTDTYAYDFARLIEWATGNTRQTAGEVVSNTAAISGLTSTKANAEDYLNDDEIAVLKQYYQSCTGANDSQWDSLFSEVFNVAPGYIYTNPALLNTVIAALGNNNISFTTETTNYSSLFGKYMEVLQRYAVSTTKVNSHDVAPCQEQYNATYLWYHSSTSGLTSFTAVASDGTTYTSKVNYTCTVEDGSYWYRGSRPSGAPGRGSNDGDYGGFYATAAYAADRTSYITTAEYQVVMMFWLNVCANNLTTDITDTNKTKIQNVLTTNSEYYSKYGIGYFDKVGKAIINAFDACMEIPTYFSTDGVAKLIKAFYDNYDSTGYKLTTYAQKAANNTTTFDTILNGDIPYVTNLDNLKSVLSYFVNLEQLHINGALKLSAFLSENGLATVFARTSLLNKKIERLTMKYVAHSTVNFDLTNIKNFENLKYLDISNNQGIQSVNELVNVNRKNYIEVNITNIGISYEYQEFAIDNIATTSCTVYYTDNNNSTQSSNDPSKASDLADLSDFNKFISKYMYMTNVIYDDDPSTDVGDDTVYWRIEEGNEINSSTITDGGNYPSISTFDEMNQLISPYYYCSQSFTYKNMSFEAGKLYKITYNNSNLIATLVGSYNKIDTLDDSNINIDTTVGDHSSYTPTTEITLSKTIEETGTVTYSNKTDWYTGTTYLGDKISEIKLIYTAYDRSSQYNRTTSVTLPSYSSLKTSITNYLTNNGYTVNDVDFNVEIVVTSWNINSSSSFNDSWQHGLLYNGQVIGYSPKLVGGQTSFQFDTLTSTAYLGKTLNIRYNNNKGSSNNIFYYPIQNASWTNLDRQCFDKVVINLYCTVNHKADVDSEIIITYNDDTIATYTGYYAAGYIIKKSTGTTILYTETEKTIFDYEYGNNLYTFYAGPNTTVLDENGNIVNIKQNTLLYVQARFIYPENSRSRSYRIVGEVYTADFWYIKEQWLYNNFTNGFPGWFNLPDSLNVDGAGLIDGETIKSVTVNGTTYDFSTYFTSILPANSTTRTNVSGFDVDWNTVPLTSNWTFDKFYYNSYLNYVSDITPSNHSLLNQQNDFYTNVNKFKFIYKYTGSTTTEGIYVLSLISDSVTYKENYAYILNVDNGVLVWNQFATSLDDPTDATLDSILAEANEHFGDIQYGYYYGRYYGYNGIDIYTAAGNYYENGYIYRIMPNESNTAFTWVKVSSFMTDTSGNILKALGTGQLNVGDICYSTQVAFSPYFGPGWYKVILDEKTNIVNLVKFNDLGITITDNYTQLTNDKLVARSGDYLGYSGTFNVQISALIRIKQADGSYIEYIKTYKMKFVGSLTS